MLKAAQAPEVQSALVNRPAMGNFPQQDWATILRSGLLRAAPKGLDKVFTSTTGSDANELAYKAAFMWKRRQQRGEGADFTSEEVSSAMENKAPGAPNMSILSFKKGFHGRLFGSLTTTRSKAIHKLDIPAFDWPAAPFPQLKYPLKDHARENAAEEQQCLDEVERLISEWHSPPAAVVVEPIQSEGGDNHASPAFFRALRELARKHNILFIVDEVQTGVGATGKFWAHEHWDLPLPPDMVTFSKKAQAAGYFYSDARLRPQKAYRQFNTWMGDPARAIMFKAMLNEIEGKNLVRNTAVVGEYLHSGLLRLQERYPDMVLNLRGEGQGTFIAFDCPRRDEIIRKSKSSGLNIGGCGERTIRLRPMLVFQHYHGTFISENCVGFAAGESLTNATADILLEILESLLKD